MKLKYFTALGLASLLPSCNGSNSPQRLMKAEAEQVKIEEPFFQGKVIKEVKLYNTQILSDYPYAFTLKDDKNMFFTVNVQKNYAAFIDSLVDEGDIVKIKGQTANTNYFPIWTDGGPSVIEITEKATPPSK